MIKPFTEALELSRTTQKALENLSSAFPDSVTAVDDLASAESSENAYESTTSTRFDGQVKYIGYGAFC